MIDTPQPTSRTFKCREKTYSPVTGDRHSTELTIWMIDTFDPPVAEIATLTTPLLTVHSSANFDAAALADGILSMLTNFGLPDSENPRQFVEVPKTDADKSITGR